MKKLCLLVMVLCLSGLGCARDDLPRDPGLLIRTARYGETAKVKACLEAGIDYQQAAAGFGLTALHWAVLDENPEVVELLLARAKRDGTLSALLEASDQWGARVLHWAAAETYPEVLGLLIAAGAEVNAPGPSGNTALHLAVLSAKKSAPRIVKALLRAGADPGLTNRAGETVAQLALRRDRPEMVALLEGENE